MNGLCFYHNFSIWKRRATLPASSLFVVKLLINEGISFPFNVLPPIYYSVFPFLFPLSFWRSGGVVISFAQHLIKTPDRQKKAVESHPDTKHLTMRMALCSTLTTWIIWWVCCRGYSSYYILTSLKTHHCLWNPDDKSPQVFWHCLKQTTKQ